MTWDTLQHMSADDRAVLEEKGLKIGIYATIDYRGVTVSVHQWPGQLTFYIVGHLDRPVYSLRDAIEIVDALKGDIAQCQPAV